MNYEDHQLLDFILNAHVPVSAQDILLHLNQNVEGFTARQPKGDSGLKNIQNRLKNIADCQQFSNLIKVTMDGRRNLYSRRQGTFKAGPPMEFGQACALLMADKHLSAVSPTRLFQHQSEFQGLVKRADEAVRKEQYRGQGKKADIGHFMKRVAVVHRGQRLIGATVDDKVLECIATCIARKRCISLTYKGRQRVLHPYGLVFREPKIYLLAVDKSDMARKGRTNVRPHTFQCNLIKRPRVSREAHKVPETFDVDSYIKEGRLDIPAPIGRELIGAENIRSFTLKLRLTGEPEDNLIRDLKEFSLSATQTIVKERGTGNYLLTAPGMYPTHSLVEWIMGRMERVEVLEPKRLRSYVGGKIAAMHQNYQE